MKRLCSVLLACCLIAPAASASGPGRASIPDKYKAVSDALRRYPRQIPIAGNGVDIIDLGKDKLSMMVADLESATSYILLDYYRIKDDETGRRIRDVLVRKAREGVKVKLCYENVVNYAERRRFFEDMAREGIEVRYFTDTDSLPIWTLFSRLKFRDHRKLAIIDGTVAYLGGMNLSNHYVNDWKDTHVRICGPAVESVQELFNANWRYAGGENVAFAPVEHGSVAESGFKDKTVQIISTGHGESALEQCFASIFSSAKTYLYIQTPYLEPTALVMESLKKAAASGTDVRLLVPRDTDMSFVTKTNRSFFEELVSSGVRVWEYLPRFNHGKVFVTDGDLAGIGSVNMDHLSLEVNYEDCALFFDEELAGKCRETFISLLEESREVLPADIEGWSRWTKASCRFHRFFAPIL